MEQTSAENAHHDMSKPTALFVRVEQEYAHGPVSAFQRQVRGEATVLRDHICKKLNNINMERCRCIPKNTPGADWRTLLEIVAADPSREKFEVLLPPLQPFRIVIC